MKSGINLSLAMGKVVDVPLETGCKFLSREKGRRISCINIDQASHLMNMEIGWLLSDTVCMILYFYVNAVNIGIRLSVSSMSGDRLLSAVLFRHQLLPDIRFKLIIMIRIRYQIIIWGNIHFDLSAIKLKGLTIIRNDKFHKSYHDRAGHLFHSEFRSFRALQPIPASYQKIATC